MSLKVIEKNAGKLDDQKNQRILLIYTPFSQTRWDPPPTGKFGQKIVPGEKNTMKIHPHWKVILNSHPHWEKHKMFGNPHWIFKP